MRDDIKKKHGCSENINKKATKIIVNRKYTYEFLFSDKIYAIFLRQLLEKP